MGDRDAEAKPKKASAGNERGGGGDEHNDSQEFLNDVDENGRYDYEPGEYADYGQKYNEYSEYPWTREYNEEYGAWYYYNELTNESVWEGEETVSPASEAFAGVAHYYYQEQSKDSDAQEEEPYNGQRDDTLDPSATTSTDSSSLKDDPEANAHPQIEKILPELPNLAFKRAICVHGLPMTVNAARRQYWGCRRCALVGSLMNSIEDYNPLGSISLISRGEEGSTDLIETRDSVRGFTALMAAAGAKPDGDVESMLRLVEMKANVEVFDKKGRSLIHIACANGCIESVREILKNRSFWHRKPEGEATKGSIAAALGKSRGGVSDPDSMKIQPLQFRDKRDRTPLRHATKSGNVVLVAYLLDRGAKMEADLLSWMDDHKDELSGCRKMRGSRPPSRASTSQSRPGSRSSNIGTTRTRK